MNSMWNFKEKSNEVEWIVLIVTFSFKVNITGKSILIQ